MSNNLTNVNDSNLLDNWLQNICNSKFWDNNLTWNTNKPTLTECFVDTALIWPPVIFIWIYFPYIMYNYMNSDRPPIAYNLYNVIKKGLAILMTIMEFIHAIHATIMMSKQHDSAQYISLAHLIALWLTGASYLLMIFYLHFQRKKGFVNCSIVWYYLLFILVCNVITIHVSFQHRPFEHWLYLPMKLAIQFFLFIMCSFSDYFKISSNNANHPKDSASIPSRMIFWWFNRLAILGYRRPLTENDLWLVRKHDTSEYLMKLFYKYADHKNDDKKKSHKIEDLNKNDKISNDDGSSNNNNNNNKNMNGQNKMKTKDDVANKKAYNLWKIIFIQMYGSYFLFPAIGRLITELLQLVNPFVLKAMINYTNNSDIEMWHGILYSLTLFLINMIHSLSTVYQQHRFSVLALRIRSTLIGAIYRKSLLLSSQARKDYSTGDIVNLMAIDSQRFIDMVRHANYLWTAPVLILIGFYLLYQEIGWSVVGGFVLMFLLIPIQGYVTRLIKSIQLKQMKLKDERIRATNELLNGMKIMKLYSWENAFLQKIQNIRMNELRFIKLAGIITVVFISVGFCSPFLITFIVFAIYTKWQQLLLTSEKAFVTIALFNLLRLPLSQMPNMISSLTLTIISMKRITKFLNADEIENYVHNSPMSNEIAINVSDASFSWDFHDEARPILSNINLKIKTGKLIAIVGQVGSGKSSLLFALLGEMHKYKGSVLFNEKLKIAYIAQQAWIQNLTVRDNIIFGYDFDENRYKTVIKACELESDLKMFDHGDQTEIGEKGINLSGGQKQRISIARACYSDSDLYLFDDPLSAVDSHVGKNIFEQVLSNGKGILKNKTRILVTNALYVLPMVDQIVLLRNGTISDIGSCQELLKNNTFFRELFNSYHQQSHHTEDNKHQHSHDLHHRESTTDRKDSIDMDHHHHHHHHHHSHHHHHHHHHQTESYMAARRLTLDTLSDSISLSSTSTYDSFEEEETPQATNKNTDGKLVETESIETGTISFAVYKKFLSSLTPMWFILILIGYVLYISFNVIANFRLSIWTNNVDNKSTDNGNELWNYFSIGIMQVVFIACGWLSIVFGCLRASRTLHERLLNSIIHAPMYFFDCTPLGRIMNRFSRDIDIFDNNMSLLIRILITHTLQVIVTLIIISIKSPMFLVFVVPFLIVYLFIQRFYVSTTRQLKRIESITSSPIFTHFAETLNGVSTIKAYNVCPRFIEESNKRVDKNFQCTYPNSVANCWLLIRLEFLSNLLIFFASFMSTLNKLMDGIGLTGSEIGLSLSYALNVTLSLSWFVRVTAELENNIVSVERVSEYINIEAEADWETDHDQVLPIGWPSGGKIDFENYATRYRPGLNLVLKGINLKIQQGEKIGIVGRTGAGKSSLTLGLFRLIEAAGGSIRIDNHDISKLGLHKLRSCLTIIPQDPVLFSGTIRFNLDPFEKYADEQLWQVLELAHLKTFVASLPSNMDYQVSEDGENLSVGQRQLFCLARALLRHTKVLVLDEATASVDFETDALIQSTIRKEFAECTVLTIAHRLNTIMDSSRVLVLDAGNVAEFDTPKSLLANRASIFYSLAKDAGITHYAFDSKVKQKT